MSPAIQAIDIRTRRPSRAPSEIISSDPRADARLLALVDEYTRAHEEMVRAWKLNDQYAKTLERLERTRRRHAPEALRVQKGDVALGIPAPFGRRKIYYAPCDIAGLRGDQSKTRMSERGNKTVFTKEPWPARQARADEIVSAFDAFHIHDHPDNSPTFVVAAAATDHEDDLGRKIFETPARTIEGIRAKLKCVASYGDELAANWNGCGSLSDSFAVSIARDLGKLLSVDL